MAAATKCEVEQCAPAGSPEPTASDNTPPRPSRKTRRQEWYQKNGSQQNTAVQCCSCQTRLQKTAKKQSSGRLQTPLNKSGKATGGRKKQRKGKNGKSSQPVLQNDQGDQQKPVITRSQLSKHSTYPSRFSSRNQIIEAWRNASRLVMTELGQQDLIEDLEIQVNSPHVVDGIPVRVEKSSIDTRTGTTYSQSTGNPSTADTPATEVSEGWSSSPGVLASVGGQFEEPALPQTSPAAGRSSATIAVASENKETVRKCSVIITTVVGDADDSEWVEEEDGGSAGQRTFKQIDSEAPFPWGMSKCHLDWINNEDLHNNISLVVQRAFTFPCSGRFHFEEDSVDSFARSQENP